MKNKKFSTFDYTVTISRRHRYLVVGAPEFGYQVAADCVEVSRLSPDAIGEAVLKVLDGVQRRLYDLDRQGLPHPPPRNPALMGRAPITAREAARILGISRGNLRRLVATGALQAQRTAGGHLRISLDALSDFLIAPPPSPTNPAIIPAIIPAIKEAI
jgi:excisionase family DNA binding protein